MYQRAISSLLALNIYKMKSVAAYFANASRPFTMAENIASTPRKKNANMVAIISTMIAVCTVSARVGHTILPTSVRTWRMNSPGLVFAIEYFLL
jgi:hypothetical protein